MSKGKGGRPSKFDKIDKEQVRKLAVMGWTDAQMSDFFGVAESTWNSWKTKHEGFLESLKGWKDEADHRVERSLYERATGYEHAEDKMHVIDGSVEITETVKHYPPDTTAAIFWLKNRKPGEWADRKAVEHTSPDGSMTPQQTIYKLPDNGRDGGDGG